MTSPSHPFIEISTTAAVGRPENEIDAAAGRQESIPNGPSPDHHRSGDVSPPPCFFLHRPCLFPAIIQSTSNSRSLPVP
ncbi:unnamed protein product [Linum trigynum]|uniref:Uncharacterized protein n=1 Tax=Linum trigynum TaxID=586398 RepID=A0AAV2DK25_9ROSI